MNYEIIAAIVLAFSALGLVIIILRKIPALVILPEASILEGEGLSGKFKKAVLRINPFKNFSSDLFLHKILTKIRILSLKTDHKTFNLLQRLRERTQKKKLENDNYWDEIKKAKEEK